MDKTSLRESEQPQYTTYHQEDHYTPNLYGELDDVEISHDSMQWEGHNDDDFSRPMQKRWCSGRRLSLFCEILLVIVGIGLIIQMFFVPKMVNDTYYSTVEERLIMTRDKQLANSTSYQKWVSNTFDDSGIQIFKYYLYNITNYIDVTEGAIPQLEEIGPFTYRRYEFRRDVVFSDDSCSVSYTYNYEFIYQDHLSTQEHSLSDTIVVLNSALLTYINLEMMFGDNEGLWDKMFMKLPAEAVFYIKPIYRLLFGVSDPILETNTPPHYEPNNSTWYQVINTDPVDTHEYTGHCQHDQMRQLIEFWNTTGINWWAETESVSPSRETKNWPHSTVEKTDTLSAWITPVYRKTNYTYEKQVARQGVKLWRFHMSNDVWKNSSNVPYNARFYQEGPDGLVNLTSRRQVKQSLPVHTLAWVSLGHYNEAPYYYRTAGEPQGLPPPNNETDIMFFDIDEKSGAVFQSYLSYMISISLFPLKKQWANNFSELPNIIVPMSWLEVDGHAPDDVAKDYANQLTIIDTIEQASIYGGPSFAVICFAIVFWLVCRRKQRDQWDKEDTQPQIVMSTTHTDRAGIAASGAHLRVEPNEFDPPEHRLKSTEQASNTKGKATDNRAGLAAYLSSYGAGGPTPSMSSPHASLKGVGAQDSLGNGAL